MPERNLKVGSSVKLKPPGLEFADYFPTRGSSLTCRKKGDHFMDIRKIFSFSPFFPLTEWSNLPRPGFPTWECLERPEAEPWAPLARPPLHLSRVPATPLQLHLRSHTHVYSSTENLTSQTAPGIRLFSTLKVFI